jgi:hypothetical protein
MELFAAGFNALDVSRLQQWNPHNDDAEDLSAFTLVLKSAWIGRPVSRLCYTVGMRHVCRLRLVSSVLTRDETAVQTGSENEEIQVSGLWGEARDLRTFQGKKFDLRCVEAANGQVVVVKGTKRPRSTCSKGGLRKSAELFLILGGEAGSEQKVSQYASYQAAQNRSNGTAHPEVQTALQVVSYETGFAALTSDGNVWTWGDPRYPDCLGRTTTSE